MDPGDTHPPRVLTTVIPAPSWPCHRADPPASVQPRSVSVFSSISSEEHAECGLCWDIYWNLWPRNNQNPGEERYCQSWRKMLISTNLRIPQHHRISIYVPWVSMITNTAQTWMMTSRSMTFMSLKKHWVTSPQVWATSVRRVQRQFMRILEPGWDQGRNKCLKVLYFRTVYKWTNFIQKTCMKWFLLQDQDQEL